MEILRSPVIGQSKLLRGVRRILCFFWMIYNLLRFRYDVVHIGSLPGINPVTSWATGYFLALIARLRHAQTVYTYTLADNEDEAVALAGLSGRIKRLFLNEITHIVSISPALRDALQYRFPNKKISLIINGARDDIFRPLNKIQRSQARSALGFNEDAVIFSFLGTISYRKGFDILAKAFAELSSQHLSWELLVIGPKSRRENQNILDSEVEEVTAEIRDHPRVHFLGRIDAREKLGEYLGASDVFVFPSRREGLGNAPMEAMAAGVPVIVTRLPGITDLANIHEQTGLYVEPDDVEQLKNAMCRLGEDLFLRQHMGQAARQRIEEAFSWEQYVSRWEELYLSSG